MNILAPYNWIKEFVTLKESAGQFARKISLSGPSVERLYPQSPPFDRMVVGRINEVKPHPHADKQRIASVDVGAEVMELVCGGSNLAPGMKVAVALVGAKVRWHGQGDLIELKSAEIRGVKSEGMICGASEIGLADAFPHAEKEILDLSRNKAKPGASLAKALDLDETVFDIEVTTNRPDAFSMIGLAREAAAILGGKFLWREGVIPSPSKSARPLPLTVKNQATGVCTKYLAVAMDNVSVIPSPPWLKSRLRMAGLRPINTVVDITNYILLEYGQPMHAFDYDKLADNSIIVRHAKAGEKMKALDGNVYEFAESQVVIADAEKPVAVAGVMGGEETGVTDKTTSIVFECATFDPVSVRRTARALNLHSDSSLRYEKGLPEELTHAALARAVELCQKVALGRVAGPVIDLDHAPVRKNKFQFRPAKAAELIGVGIPKKTMVAILKTLGFGVVPKGGSAKDPRYEVTVPYWRVRDIEDERDFAEEIARVYGYANLPSEMPTGELPLAPQDPVIALEDRAKDFLRAAGYTEFLQYSMVSKEQLEKYGFDLPPLGRDPAFFKTNISGGAAGALRIANPLTSDFEFMRPSLIPGTLTTISQNQGLFPEGRVFEVSQIYLKRDAGLPEEKMRLLATAYGRDSGDGLYRDVKGLLEAFIPPAAGVVTLERVADDKHWHPGRSARVLVEGETVGTVGEIHPALAAKFGLDVRAAALDLDVVALAAILKPSLRYVPVSLYPPVLRDLAFIVPERTEFADVLRSARAAAPLLADLELFDVYRGKGVDDGKKSMAVHLTFVLPDRTLTAEEAEGAVNKVLEALTAKFGAVRRG